MAREAVAVAAGTDLVLDHAEACLALGRVLAAAGDEPGATEARREAEALYAAKEVASSMGRAVESATPSDSSPAVASTGPTTSRLAIANRASEIVDAALAGDAGPRRRPAPSPPTRIGSCTTIGGD